MNPTKKSSMKPGYLYDVVLIRPILIILLVFFHAFAPFSGGWEPINGYPVIKAYWWLDWLSYSFMLETFVFISGYVYGYQVRIKGETKLEIKSLLKNKVTRLLIPSFFFSFLYILIFQDITQPLHKTAYEVIRGVGHMWFLPMLFWCFLSTWFIEKIRINPKVVTPILVLLSIFPFVPIPFQIGKTMYYMLFFYFGYEIQRREIDVSKYYTKTNVGLLLVLFSVLFPILTIFKCNIDSIGGGILFDIIFIPSLKHIAQLIYSMIGLLLLFCSTGFFIKQREQREHRDKEMPYCVVCIGQFCMGVYLFQQFILKAIYYHTTFPQRIDAIILPWIGFIVALLLSILLSYLFKLSKVGRILIG